MLQGPQQGATGSEGALADARRPLTAAERMRRSRARRRAELLAERERRAREPLRLALAAQAEAELRQVEQHLAEDQRALPLVERVLEGSRALVLALYGNPLLRLAETANAPPEVLARLLDCSMLDAQRLALDAQRELLDRLFGRPQPAKGGSDAPPVLVQLNVTPAVAAALEIKPDQAVGAEAER